MSFYRTATLAAATSCSLFASPASAHYVYEKAFVYETAQENCVRNRSEISHGDGAGYRKTDVESSVLFAPVGASCAKGLAVPPGHIAARPVLYKWNYVKDRWEVCRDPQWTYNPGHADTYIVYYKGHGVEPPCGDGYYGTHGGSYAHPYDSWDGGWLWSGYHWLGDE